MRRASIVVIADEDIKKVAPKTAKTMEIHQFVKADDIDPVYFESSYYLAPDAGGEKPYALLFAALKETKFAGIAKIAMHNREHDGDSPAGPTRNGDAHYVLLR